jgi:hypothetical protein
MHRAAVPGSAFHVAGTLPPFAARPLSPRVRELIEAKIHDLGSRLSGYPITASEAGLSMGSRGRLTHPRIRSAEDTLHLVTLGQRREIYR